MTHLLKYWGPIEEHNKDHCGACGQYHKTEWLHAPHVLEDTIDLRPLRSIRLCKLSYNCITRSCADDSLYWWGHHARFRRTNLLMYHYNSHFIKIGNSEDRWTYGTGQKARLKKFANRMRYWIKVGYTTEIIKEKIEKFKDQLNIEAVTPIAVLTTSKPSAIKTTTSNFTKRQKEQIHLRALINIGLISQEDLK